MNDTPAALDTLITHFRDTGRKPSYYDLIITGDLGYIGKEILAELAETKGYNINANYNDCGVLILIKKVKILILVVVAVHALALFFLDISLNN